jgi:hypothetical protein
MMSDLNEGKPDALVAGSGRTTGGERMGSNVMHAGDEVEVVEAGGTLQIVRSEGAESRGQRLVRRLRNTATGRDIAGMSTDQIMALLRAE